MADAQRALRIVKHLLDFLNQQGAGLTLPSVLRFWTPDVPREWYSNAAHERAVVISPNHYHSIRLHKGTISGPLFPDGDLVIERTKYFDFDGDRTWQALRQADAM